MSNLSADLSSNVLGLTPILGAVSGLILLNTSYGAPPGLARAGLYTPLNGPSGPDWPLKDRLGAPTSQIRPGPSSQSCTGL